MTSNKQSGKVHTLPSTPVTSAAEYISLYSIYIYFVLYFFNSKIRIESVSSSLTLISLLPRVPLKHRNLDAAIRAGSWSSDRWLSRGRCVAPEHNGEQDIAGRTSEDGPTGRRRRAARIPKSACRWHPPIYSNGPVLARPRLFGRACSPASGFRAFPQRMEPARWMTENLIAQAFSKADYSNRSAFKYLALKHGTRGRTRTGTASRPRDFKSLVSTIPPPGQVRGEYPTRRRFRHIHTSSEA